MRFLHADGSYSQAQPKPGEKARRSQFEFIDLVANPRSRILQKLGGAKAKYVEVKLSPSPFSGNDRAAKT